MKLGKYQTPFMEDMEEAFEVNNGVLTLGNYLLSSPTDGGTLNPLTLTNENSVLCVAKYRGIPFGLFQNGQLIKSYTIGGEKVTGTHAEDCFMSAWEEFEGLNETLESANNFAEIKRQGLFITLKLTKSPCVECTEKLIKFKKAHPEIAIRIKIMQIYYGGASTSASASNGVAEGVKTVGRKINRLSVVALISAGFHVKEWVVFRRQHKFSTKLGLLHELRNFTAIFLDESVSKKIFNDADEVVPVLTETEKAYLLLCKRLAGFTEGVKEDIQTALQELFDYSRGSKNSELKERMSYLGRLGFDFDQKNLSLLNLMTGHLSSVYKEANRVNDPVGQQEFSEQRPPEGMWDLPD